MDVFISKIEKKYHIYLIIVIAVVIYTSIIVLPYNAVGKTLHSLEIESNSIVQNVPSFNVGISPVDIAVDDWEDNKVYVANSESNTVSVIDGDTLRVSNVNVGEDPSDIAVDESDNIAYVANRISNTVSVIEETSDGVYSNIANVNVGEGPISIAVNSLNDIAYVANSDSNTVSVIEETSDGVYSNIANVNVGEYPLGIDVDELNDIAYVANRISNTVSVIEETSDGVYSNIANVSVGEGPISIAVNEEYNIAYVANRISNTVSVIHGTLRVSNVSVGEGPISIAVNSLNDIAYVANSDSNTVSVIEETSDGVYSNIANVNVGEYPLGIDVDELNDIAYVANRISNTVSVIDGDTLRVSNVSVGEDPVSISIGIDNIIYVANSDSNTVSVIYGSSQSVQAGVSFDVTPFHGGHIECNNITVPTNQYFYVDFRTQCLAQPNKGFQFSSWIQNLGSNSSRTINASISIDSPVDWIKSKLGFGSKQTSSILTVTKFGNFTANFENLPPAIPSEYLIPLYGVIVSSIVGWSIPSIVGWAKTKKMIITSDAYHRRITSLYEDNKLDYNDIGPLDKIKIDMSNAYAKGKLSDQHYQNLKNEISVLYEEIYRKRIDSLNSKQDRDGDSLLNQIKYDIEDAYAKGKLSDQHYNLLNKKIESFVKKTSDNKTNMNKLGNTNQTDVSKRSPV